MVLGNANRDNKTRPEPFELADFMVNVAELSDESGEQSIEDQMRVVEQIAKGGAP